MRNRLRICSYIFNIIPVNSELLFNLDDRGPFTVCVNYNKSEHPKMEIELMRVYCFSLKYEG